MYLIKLNAWSDVKGEGEIFLSWLEDSSYHDPCFKYRR